MPKLSVIVPVRNAGVPVKPCAESILGQGLQELELLFISDSAAGRALELCYQYERKDSRVTVYAKPQSGLYDSFNFGLQRARGEYVLFLPGGDLLMENAAARLIEAAVEQKADLLVFGEQLENGAEALLPFDCPAADPAVNEAVLRALVGPGEEEAALRHIPDLAAPWRRFYRREWFLEKKLVFPWEQDVLPPELPVAVGVHCLSKRTLYLKEAFVVHRPLALQEEPDWPNRMKRYGNCFLLTSDFLKQRRLYGALEERHLAWYLLEAGCAELSRLTAELAGDKKARRNAVRKLLKDPLMLRALQSGYRAGFSRRDRGALRVLRTGLPWLVERYFSKDHVENDR